MTFDRRNFMIGAGMVAGGALLAPVVGLSSAHAAPAPKAQGQAPAYYRTKVGAITVTTILDGSMTFADELFDDAKQDMLDQARRDYFIKPGKSFPGFINVYLVETNGKRILIDTGARGYGPTMGKMKGTLALLGITPDMIDEVILTHAHPDHTNGLLDDQGKATFAKSKIRICDTELNFWFDDAKEAQFSQKKQLFDFARKNLGPYKTSGQIETYKFDADLGGGLSSVALPGHTPGHSGVRISDGSDQLLIWADIVHNAFLQFDHPEQSLSFDTDEDQARATRKKIFDQVASDRLRIGGMHLPFTAIGHLAKKSEGYAFVPQPWEADI